MAGCFASGFADTTPNEKEPESYTFRMGALLQILLNNKLAGLAFGQVLPEAKNFAYVGGPNATVVMGQINGLVFGEMWIPVVGK